MLKYYFLIIFLGLVFLQPLTVLAQSSIVWDEKTKSWISAAAPTTTQPQPQPQQQQTQQQPAVTPTVPATQPQPQPQPQPQQPPPTIIQTVPTTAPNAAVDLGTLATVITPIIGAIAGIFIKNKKDMEKKEEEVKKSTVDMIQQAIMPTLKQVIPVAEQTAKQDLKLKEFGDLIYKIMGEEANKISGMPEIQQQKLLEDAVRSRMVAQQTKQQQQEPQSSIVWDEATKSWVSK